MSIGGLALLSAFGGTGAVYIYTGITGTRRIFLWCGLIMAVLPFLLQNVLLLCAAGISLALLPYLVHRKAPGTKS